jgi:hypothetical protein
MASKITIGGSVFVSAWGQDSEVKVHVAGIYLSLNGRNAVLAVPVKVPVKWANAVRGITQNSMRRQCQ